MDFGEVGSINAIVQYAGQDHQKSGVNSNYSHSGRTDSNTRVLFNVLLPARCRQT